MQAAGVAPTSALGEAMATGTCQSYADWFVNSPTDLFCAKMTINHQSITEKDHLCFPADSSHPDTPG